MHVAASAGELEMLKILMDAGADPNLQVDLPNEFAYSGRTPLYFAVAWDRVECVEMLISRGANRDLKDAKGLTPADEAEQRESADTIKLLRKH